MASWGDGDWPLRSISVAPTNNSVVLKELPGALERSTVGGRGEKLGDWPGRVEQSLDLRHYWMTRSGLTHVLYNLGR